mmetsp:Transcript_33244/g.73520  ORF Transcript_33244/g.73520 Transcript_33244/m.73520 type:complete len:262 (+) Transcript_33244:792-1577(+)
MAAWAITSSTLHHSVALRWRRFHASSSRLILRGCLPLRRASASTPTSRCCAASFSELDCSNRLPHSSRSGRMLASLQTCIRSLPLYLASRSDSCRYCSGLMRVSTPSIALRIMAARVWRSGRDTYTRRANLLSAASSRSQGLLVAAMIMMRESSQPPPWMPSMKARNSLVTLLSGIESWPCPALRLPSRESTSSMKMTAGCCWRARSNNCLTFCSLWPNHMDRILEPVMGMKVARLSVATARANMVLPLPGGPNSRMPRGG